MYPSLRVTNSVDTKKSEKEIFQVTLKKLLLLDAAGCPAVREHVAGEAVPARDEPREAGEAWLEDDPRTRGELSLSHRAGRAS